MSLLEVIQINTKKSPIMMSSPVAPELDGPFLVTSTKGFVWVIEKFPGNFIRSATRKANPNEVFSGVVKSILDKSLDDNWGSVKPLTYKGLQESILYLSYYGFSEFDVFFNSKEDFKQFERLENVYYSWQDWVPKGQAVVAPVDKSYLGTLYSFGKGNFACCVHNPSRGICILKG